MTITEKLVKKPVTTLLVFLMVIGLGIFSAFDLPVSLMPKITFPTIYVITTYPNAGPEEVEQSVTKLLESTLSSVGGLKKLTSTSSYGNSQIGLSLNYETNLDTATNEIRDKIDRVRSYLPKDVETPMIMKIDLSSYMPIMQLAVNGQRSPEELHEYAEKILQPRLEQIDGVASASIGGGREQSINVEIPRDRLEAYGLSITQVAQMIGAQNLQTSGGTITSDEKNYTIKTDGKYKSIEDLKNTVISYKVRASDGLSNPEVVSLRLRDIADVYEGFKNVTSKVAVNGESCVYMMIQKQSDKNDVETAANVRKVLNKIRAEKPKDIDIIEIMATTDYIENAVSGVVSSVVIGALLAIAILLIFLRSLKSTIIIGLAIPVSVFITLFLMYLKGITINVISMSGLLLGIGMLVDNSIVILENIYSYRQRDAKPTVAAVLGSQEMIASISSSTFTSICIFLPMVIFKSKLEMLGQYFDNLAYTIIFSLVCSLVVAIALVPVLCSSWLKIDKIEIDNKPGFTHNLNRGIDLFFQKLDNAYAKGVEFVLYHKKLVLLSLIGLFVLSIISIKVVGFIFMPSSSEDYFGVSFELPNGTPLEKTDELLTDFTTKAASTLKGVKNTVILAGTTGAYSADSSNTGTVYYIMHDSKSRKPGWDNAESAKAKLYKMFNDYPGAKISFGSGGSGMGGSGVTIKVASEDLDLLRSTGRKMENMLKEKGSDFIQEVTSNLSDGLPQVQIVVDRSRMYELGLNIANIGSEISAAINGTTASKFTKNGTDIDVVVKLAEKDKTKLADLDQISVLNSSGNRIPLSSFAHYEQTLSPVSITRSNQSRYIEVTVKPLPGQKIDVVQRNILKLINDNIPADDSVQISFSGDFEDLEKMGKNFALIIFMAAILVFTVMAAQFESFADPFIIILTIPLSFIGVVAIYVCTWQPINVMTFMGFLILVGTIVNNGIVLVDYTNLLRKRGYTLDNACVEAARSRLRPILMSTLTTVISLMPMAFFPDEASKMMQPIALTVFGGMTFGSLMTLFLMPAIYHFINSRRFKKAAKKQMKKELKEEKRMIENDIAKEESK